MRERAAAKPAGSRLSGGGWIETRWSPPVFPTRQDLDAATPNRPVVLKRGQAQALVANSLALRRAGIDKTTPDPPGGALLRDAAGEPTGMLIDNAMELVERLVPPPTAAETAHSLEVGARCSVELGWTQLQIAGNTASEVDQLSRLHAAGRIQLRLYDAIYGPSADASRLLIQGPDPQHRGSKLALRGIKLYRDGALGSRGAALLAP